MEIKDLQKWYFELDERAEQVKQYENAMFKFHKKLNINADYTKPFVKDFYKKEKLGKYLPKLVLSNLGGILITTFITILASWSCLTMSKHTNPIIAISKHGLDNIKPSLLLGILALVIVTLIVIASKIISFNSLKKNIIKQEKIIMDLIKTIPPNFRSYDRISTLARVYYTKQDVEPETAFKICEEVVIKNGDYPFLKIMFDVDYANPLLDDSQVVEENTISQDVLKNPNLPQDIISKTFTGSKDSSKDLELMIGLNSVKDQIQKLENRMKFYGNANNNGNHMAFMGSAGTGKTTIARIITKILFDLGLISKNQYVEISGDYLRSGNTARASAILDYAMGGVLFIDEAYLLYDKNGQGVDATGVLLKAMEDRRKDFVCILAGYEEQMTKLIASNEGFSSRIKHTIYFPDYNENEMLEIFNSLIGNYNGNSYILDNNAKDTLLELFRLEKQAKSFGNARTVRNTVDGIMDYFADRNINSNVSFNIIKLEDVEKYVNDRKNILQHELRNSSASNQLDESIIRLSELKSKLKNGASNPTEELSHYIGLESFKKEMDLLKSQKEFYNETNQQKILFIGPDGCGKKSMAKILTGYLYEYGYIQENKYLEISAEFMKGSYVGHTSRRAEAIISYASGGVLFIKNINMLVDSTDSYAQEVLSAIMNALQENHNVTIVIADTQSNYLDNIKSMFTLVYEFPIYDAMQLYQIFANLVIQDGFNLDQNAANVIYTHILNTPNISIRDINMIYNNTKRNHISNFVGDNKYLITASDINTNISENDIIEAPTMTQEPIKEEQQEIVHTRTIETLTFSRTNINESPKYTKSVESEIIQQPTKPKLKLNIKL